MINLLLGDYPTLIGIKVDFQQEVEDDPKTSGNGKFLMSVDTLSNKCGNESFLVDSPPHNSDYFSAQLKSATNYYRTVSNNLVDFNNHIILDSVYTASNFLSYYGQGDNYLVELFSEVVIMASDNIQEQLFDLNIDSYLLVIFHAGLGQDISVPFIDPTSHDLKSAYIDDDMFLEAMIDPPEINGDLVNRGLLLPETQNMIYYEVINDIFPGVDDLCDVQLGLTGTIVFLLGYELDLFPLFNTLNGESRVGVFGLMDVGSNNGNGVIPSPPTAFNRIRAGWVEPEIISQTSLKNITARDITNQIYKIPITDKEYFLIENVNNFLYSNVDIDSLRIKYKISDIQRGHFFDSIFQDFESGDLLELPFSIEDGVITSIENYDYGLPGSGLLIWHIDETNLSNNDLSYKIVHLEEADGAVDIGFDSMHPLFSQHVQGWEYDLWYKGNEFYLTYGNPFINDDILIFDYKSIPSSNSNQNTLSNIKIRILDSPNNNMSFYVDVNDYIDSQFISEDNIQIVGNGIINGISYIYFRKANGEIIAINSLGEETPFYQDGWGHQNVLVHNNQAYLTNSQDFTYFDSFFNIGSPPLNDLVTPSDDFVIGYLTNESVLDTMYSHPRDSISTISLADIDKDGLDELIYTDAFGVLYAENYNPTPINEYLANGTSINGFPIHGNFHGAPIIANIYNIDDLEPEIICRNGNSISIIDLSGEIIYSISSFQSDQNLSVVPNWGSENKSAIIDGRRLVVTDFGSAYSFWLNPYSRSDNYPISQGDASINISNPVDMHGFQNAYNYPNPVSNRTTFRFYVKNSNEVKINIFDLYGLPVYDKTIDDLIQNEYNELVWDITNNINSGVYFAEVIFNSGRKELIRMVVSR